jgi:GNAT superfamily N-acetyltransferase
LSAARPWQRRARTVEAIALLLLARILVAVVPFARWRGRLGWSGEASTAQFELARLLAAHVEFAAARLGLPLKCLPRAMALSWMLRRRGIAHRLIVAARPQAERDGVADALHAWVECRGETVLGKLDGPWIELLNLP